MRRLALIVVTCTLALQAKAQPTNLSFLTNGLRAYYPLDANAKDESGNANDGTIHGTTAAADRFGRASGALAFGGNSYIELPETIGLKGATNATLSLWVSPLLFGSSQGDNVMFDHAMGDVAGGVPSPPRHLSIYFYTNGGLEVEFVEYGAFAPRPLSTNQWYQVALTFDGSAANGGQVLLYLDGKTDAATSDGQPPPAIPAYFFLNRTILGGGTGPEGGIFNGFSGSIDDVRIYNRTLSADEVAALYAYESVGRPSLTIRVKTVQVDMQVEPGKKYQLESSTDVVNWATNGPPFVAASPLVSQDFNVVNGPRFFRLVEVP